MGWSGMRSVALLLIFIVAIVADLEHAGKNASSTEGETVGLHSCRDTFSPKRIAPFKDKIDEAKDSLNDDFEYVMFFGYPRSGHSLVGAMLDAHQSIYIANELDVFGHFHTGDNWSEDELVDNIFTNSIVCSDSRIQANYDYTIPGGFQGQHKGPIRVIGDKKGAESTSCFRNWEDGMNTMKKLRAVLDDHGDHRMVFVHVMRNPYDMIATRSLRTWWTKHHPDEVYSTERIEKEYAPVSINLESSIRAVLREIATNTRLRKELPDEFDNVVWHDMFSEDVIKNPKKELSRLLETIKGNPPTKKYLKTATSIVLDHISRTRHLVKWKPEWVSHIQEAMDADPFFKVYSFST